MSKETLMEETKLKKEAYISIEKMLFGDYRVQVWDENLNSLLNRQYFCRGEKSAFFTALEIQNSLFPELKIKHESIPDGIPNELLG